MKRLLALLCLASVVHAQEPALLPVEQRTNGAATLDALSMIQSSAKRSVAQVLDDQNNAVQLAVVASEDGYILTKASEAPNHQRFTLAWFDGTQSEATVVVVDRTLDLLLARTARTDLTPIVWTDSKGYPAGTWMCAFDQGKPNSPSLPLRLGNISAKRRQVLSQRRGAALGIEMDNDTASEGVRIIDFGVESPAQRAGLLRNDVIFAIEDTRVTSIDLMHAEMDHREPGERVKLAVRRGKQDREVIVQLASRSKVVSNWTGEDYANGGVSLRTDDFPEVLQHQMPLSPPRHGRPAPRSRRQSRPASTSPEWIE